MDAHREHLERMLGATTTVLFVAGVSYIALNMLYGCLCDDLAPGLRKETKCALDGIPVRVIVLQLPCDAGSARGTEADDCAVCMAEYTAGDQVHVFPALRHGFHRECVDCWLLTRAPTCPALVVAHVEDADAGKEEDDATGHGAAGVDGSRAIIPAV